MGRIRGYSSNVDSTIPSGKTRLEYIELALACLDQAELDAEQMTKVIMALPDGDKRPALQRVKEWFRDGTRKPYTKPVLRELGTVNNLTLGALSTGVPEGGNTYKGHFGNG